MPLQNPDSEKKQLPYEIIEHILGYVLDDIDGFQFRMGIVHREFELPPPAMFELCAIPETFSGTVMRRHIYNIGTYLDHREQSLDYYWDNSDLLDVDDFSEYLVQLRSIKSFNRIERTCRLTSLEDSYTRAELFRSIIFFEYGHLSFGTIEERARWNPQERPVPGLTYLAPTGPYANFRVYESKVDTLYALRGSYHWKDAAKLHMVQFWPSARGERVQLFAAVPHQLKEALRWCCVSRGCMEMAKKWIKEEAERRRHFQPSASASNDFARELQWLNACDMLSLPGKPRVWELRAQVGQYEHRCHDDFYFSS